ncbi:uncharacterized protein LOC133985283 [Scomber scombrus]|uniref:uncharacterized protein LOC133985283 n=1 Tax=Scomber scombrus TaxID=13677 RepID=UPI002DD92701|nr:uncharacterized protein LOC133985283 [Scomber scombrus]
MMKLILSLTLIWTLSSTAEALSCLVGEGDSNSPQSCNFGEVCATTATQVNKSETITKRECVSSSLYREGTHVFSFNIGFDTTTVSVHVCTTNGCNNQAVPVNLNNLQCFTCDDPSSAECNRTVQCVGVQDRCISGTTTSAGKDVFFGCVSEKLCDPQYHLEFLMKVKFRAPPKCYRSSVNNSAWSVKLNEVTSLLTTLFGLITLIFY